MIFGHLVGVNFFFFFLTCLIDIILLEDLIEIVKLKILIIIIYNTWDANHLMSL